MNKNSWISQKSNIQRNMKAVADTLRFIEGGAKILQGGEIFSIKGTKVIPYTLV